MRLDELISQLNSVEDALMYDTSAPVVVLGFDATDDISHVESRTSFSSDRGIRESKVYIHLVGPGVTREVECK